MVSTDILQPDTGKKIAGPKPRRLEQRTDFQSIQLINAGYIGDATQGNLNTSVL